MLQFEELDLLEAGAGDPLLDHLVPLLHGLLVEVVLAVPHNPLPHEGGLGQGQAHAGGGGQVRVLLHVLKLGTNCQIMDTSTPYILDLELLCEVVHALPRHGEVEEGGQLLDGAPDVGPQLLVPQELHVRVVTQLPAPDNQAHLDWLAKILRATYQF